MKGFLALAINRLAAADIPQLRRGLALLFTRVVDEPGAVPPLPAAIIGKPTSLRIRGCSRRCAV